MSVCVVFVSLCFVELVDTKIVLTAAILFYRLSPLPLTEWDPLTKLIMVLYPAGRNLCRGDCLSCVTRHNIKLNLIGPKQQLSFSTNSISVSVFLLFCSPFATLSSVVVFTHILRPKQFLYLLEM
ncbi:hypothetical protein CHARACLAT_012144 [Characodon lateralis]|uniref:Secreted protein n=1 Tax=Characodon lateralis TaxID=208331 RepID=A0ABU7EIF0_9TELE|nr:hypothetical protein [Characodon lateralis]